LIKDFGITKIGTKFLDGINFLKYRFVFNSINLRVFLFMFLGIFLLFGSIIALIISEQKLSLFCSFFILSKFKFIGVCSSSTITSFLLIAFLDKASAITFSLTFL
jgi:hypothetical protein